jgi:hypothetical protein
LVEGGVAEKEQWVTLVRHERREGGSGIAFRDDLAADRALRQTSNKNGQQPPAQDFERRPAESSYELFWPYSSSIAKSADDGAVAPSHTDACAQ